MIPYLPSAFGLDTVGFASVTDGTSNTVFMAEVLQGDRNDVRGMMWSSIGGGSSFMSRITPNNPRRLVSLGPVRRPDSRTRSASTSRRRASPASPRRATDRVRRGSEPAPRRDQLPARRRLGPIHQEHNQSPDLDRDQHDQRAARSIGCRLLLSLCGPGRDHRRDAAHAWDRESLQADDGKLGFGGMASRCPPLLLAAWPSSSPSHLRFASRSHLVGPSTYRSRYPGPFGYQNSGGRLGLQSLVTRASRDGHASRRGRKPTRRASRDRNRASVVS